MCSILVYAGRFGNVAYIFNKKNFVRDPSVTVTAAPRPPPPRLRQADSRQPPDHASQHHADSQALGKRIITQCLSAMARVTPFALGQFR